MALNALFVRPTEGATWRMDMELPFPPFPGLGIRINVYEVLNVQSVLVGDPGHDVTCIVQLEDTDPGEITDGRLETLGFEEGVPVTAGAGGDDRENTKLLGSWQPTEAQQADQQVTRP